jgi:ubiquinone/menaquinone biosynthesis C-methylase UbiE
MDKVILHLGAGGYIYEGYINVDRKPRNGSIKMELSEPWPFENNSIDGIVSMHVIQQLSWRQLLVAFREAYRVLKKGGVMRMGVTDIALEDKSLEYLLGWNNINLFCEDLLKKVLIDRMGWTSFRKHWYKRGAMPELYRIDNKRGKTVYYEVIK